MAIMVHSQPSVTSGMSSNAGANGNGFHDGFFVHGDDYWHEAPEDLIMLDPDIWRNFWGIKISKTEASWNVSKDTYTNSPFFEPQNDVVLQFKLHEINSHKPEQFFVEINNQTVWLGLLDADAGYVEGETFTRNISGYSLSRESRNLEQEMWWSAADADHLVTITIDKEMFSQSADLDIVFRNYRADKFNAYWGISALNMFEDNGGTDNDLANWASQGSNMRIATLSPDSDVNSLWNSIEAEFDQTAATLQGMVDGTKGNTYFNVGTAEEDDISAAEIADAAYQIAGYLESFFTNDGYGTLDDVAEEMWVSAAGSDFISPSQNNVNLAGRIFQYINAAIHITDADSWQKLAKGSVGDISAALLHIKDTLNEDSSNELPEGATLGDELVQGMGNLINEMKGTLSLHLQRAKWEEDQSDINTIQGGLDALTLASDRFAEEYMQMTAQLSAMTILFDMFDGESTAQRAGTAYHTEYLPENMADIQAFIDLGYSVELFQESGTFHGKWRRVEVREGDNDYAVFDGIDGFDYKIGITEHHDGTRTFDTSYGFEFV